MRLWFRELRKAHGMTQEQVAHASGTRLANVARFERGGNLGIQLIELIAKPFGVKFWEAWTSAKRTEYNAA